VKSKSGKTGQKEPSKYRLCAGSQAVAPAPVVLPGSQSASATNTSTNTSTINTSQLSSNSYLTKRVGNHHYLKSKLNSTETETRSRTGLNNYNSEVQAIMSVNTRGRIQSTNNNGSSDDIQQSQIPTPTPTSATPGRSHNRSFSDPSSSTCTSSAASTRSRRVIFPTLYESTKQDSPLFQNQERQLSFQMSIPNLKHPNNRSSSSEEQGLTPKRYSSISQTYDSKDDSSNSIQDMIGKDDANFNNSNSRITKLSELNHQELVIPSFKDKQHATSKGRSDARPIAPSASVKDLNSSPTSTVNTDLHKSNSDTNHLPRHPSILRNSSNDLQPRVPRRQSKLLSESDEHQSERLNLQQQQQYPITTSAPKDDCLNKTYHGISNKMILQPIPQSPSSHTITTTTATQTRSYLRNSESDISPSNTQSNILFQRNNLRKSLSDSCLGSLKKLSLPLGSPSLLNSFNLKASDVMVLNSSIRSRESSNMTRHISHEEMRNKIIRFDPRIWVHEVQCPPTDEIWYTPIEMARFKREAMLRIKDWSLRKQERRRHLNMISTGTGRIINLESFPQSMYRPSSKKIIYTNPALSCEAEDDEEDEEEEVAASSSSSPSSLSSDVNKKRQTMVYKEIKSILLVDSHDIFLKLLSKGLKTMLPHVKITTATTLQEALTEIEKANQSMKDMNESGEEICSHGFDIIVVEERLKPHLQPQKNVGGQSSWNGSSLIHKIKEEMNEPNSASTRCPLVIGISAYLNDDGDRLQQSGADCVWGKPPPSMDASMRNELLKKLMIKRNRSDVEELFQS